MNTKAFAIINLLVLIVPNLAEVSWVVNNTKEFKNGDTMELICTVTGECCTLSRTWNGGPSFSSLMNDGLASDNTKYGEIVHSNSFSLLIYNMDRSDFLYDYRCSYGFNVSTRSILSPPGNAHYIPAESEIQNISLSTAGSYLSFMVNVTTVFPAPNCTAKFGSADLTSSMMTTSTDNFPFKFAVISMSKVSYSCTGPINISCSVGSYSFDVLILNLTDLCLISATPSSRTASEMESSKLKVAVTVEISNVLSSFESTDFTFILDTSLNTNTLSLEDSISRILPLSTIGFLEPTLRMTNEYTTHLNEVNSTLFSLQTSNYIDETIKTGFLNNDISTSTKNSLPISFASNLDITTGMSFQNDLTQNLHIPTSELIQSSQTRYTSLYNSVLLHTQTSNIQTDSPASTSAKLNTIYIDSLSLQLTSISPVINLTLTEATNLPFGISSLLMKFSTAMRSTTIHNVSILSPSSSLKLGTFKEFSSFFEIMSTYIDNDVIFNINSIQSSGTFYMLSSHPTFIPSHTPELSFREAQFIIITCSIALVMLVVGVSLMVMYYLRKVQRAKKLKDNYDKSENTDLSNSRYPHVFHRNIVNDHPNIGKNLPVRFHNRSLSDTPYTCNYEHHWNSLAC